MGGGFGGGTHLGGGSGRGHFGASHGFEGQRFAGTRGDFGHHRGFGRRWGYGSGYYDYGCSYGYPYYNYSCYTPGWY